MFFLRCRSFHRYFLVTTLLALMAQPAVAGKINLILSDFDAVYRGDTQLLQDTISATGGNLDPNESDELETTVFEHDSSIVGVMAPSESAMYADLQLAGFPNVFDLTANTPLAISTTGFGFDWFSSDGFYLRLKIDTIDVLLTNGVFFFTTEAAVLDQALPYDLRLQDTVSVSFTGTVPAVQAGSTTSMASASGAVTISGFAVLVPEPLTVNLCLLALASGLAGTRRSV